MFSFPESGNVDTQIPERTEVNAYPLELRREQNPPGAYRVRVSRVALERVALGGYRLAAMLEELFGQ